MPATRDSNRAADRPASGPAAPVDPANAAINPDESPIFLLGTGRSGTTLLRQMLNAHPRIHLTHEAFFYAYSAPDLRGSDLQQWLDRYFSLCSFAWLGLSREEVRARALALAEARGEEMTYVDAFTAIMQCAAEKHGKVRHGEKSPLATLSLDRIFADFPDARVVYIVRDPRATVASLNRMPFATSSIGINSRLVAEQFKLIEPYLDRMLMVRLEDLTADPRTEMARILDYVGEPWSDQVLNHTEHANNDDVPKAPWMSSAKRSGASRNVSARPWAEQLGPAWVKIIEDDNRATMELCGYEPATEPVSRVARLAAQVRDIPEALASGGSWARYRFRLWRHFRSKAGLLDTENSRSDMWSLNRKAWQHYPDFEPQHLPPAPE